MWSKQASAGATWLPRKGLASTWALAATAPWPVAALAVCAASRRASDAGPTPASATACPSSVVAWGDGDCSRASPLPDAVLTVSPETSPIHTPQMPQQVGQTLGTGTCRWRALLDSPEAQAWLLAPDVTGTLSSSAAVLQQTG